MSIRSLSKSLDSLVAKAATLHRPSALRDLIPAVADIANRACRYYGEKGQEELLQRCTDVKAMLRGEVEWKMECVRVSNAAPVVAVDAMTRSYLGELQRVLN